MARPRRHGHHWWVRTGPTGTRCRPAHPGASFAKACVDLTLTETRQDLANFRDQSVKMSGEKAAVLSWGPARARETSGDVCRCAWWSLGPPRLGVAQASSGQRPGCCSASCCAQGRPHNEERSGPNVNSAEVQKAWSDRVAGLQDAGASGTGGEAPASRNASSSSRPDVVLRPAPPRMSLQQTRWREGP